MTSLDLLFAPKTVAVIGASADITRLGSRVLKNVLDSGFAGETFAVGRGGGEVFGVPCLTSVEALPQAVDVAFLAIPSPAIVEAVRQCAARGVKFAIIGAAGFAESGEEGRGRQAELTRIARETGIRLVGPNCNGVYGAHAPVSIGFNTGHSLKITPGDVAIISHSGALFDVFARRLMAFGAGLSFFVSAGNEADLSMLDYMEHAIEDPQTKVITLVMDGLSNGRRFRALCGRARAAGKLMVALKIGLSPRGEEAAVAHSSRLVSQAEAYRTLLESCGVPMAHTVEGLLAAAAFLSRYGAGSGGMVVMSTSGAGGAIMADLAYARGIPLADVPPEAVAAVAEKIRFSQLGNPIDVGVFGGFGPVPDILEAVMPAAESGVFVALMPTLPRGSDKAYAAGLGASIARTGKPHVFLAPAGLAEPTRALFEQAGLMVLTETDCCLDAVGAYLASRVVADDPPPDPGIAVTGSGPLSEPESLALLARFGVPTAQCAECVSAEAAVSAADRVGYPVVLKGVVEGVAHKSDQGLVKLGLKDAGEVAAAYAAVGGGRVVVQPMLRGELEAIVGMTNSEDVGPMLVTGLGGIHAETLDQVVMWSLPTTREAIERKLRSSALGRVVTGPRWRHPNAFPALVETLLSVQRLALAAGPSVAAIDVNPVLLGAHGAAAVDALVVRP